MSEDMERRRAEIHRNQENATRLAIANHTFDVAGTGVIEFPDSAQFELAFIERPKVAVGLVIDLDSLGEAYETDMVPPVPLVTGFVSEWDQNDRDFYVGAWCGVHIYWTAGVPTEDFTFTVDFTFTGIGIKDVDPEVRE
jgi:hypothetical protein